MIKPLGDKVLLKMLETEEGKTELDPTGHTLEQVAH